MKFDRSLDEGTHVCIRIPLLAECHDVSARRPAIRLLLVDDHGIVREGLRALLDDGEEFVIVGEADQRR